jgi:glycosyltransferase involved in cell wall biosynthesis
LKNIDIDIVIPAYFEGESILEVLYSLREHVESNLRVFICYDVDDDDTLTTIKEHPAFEFDIEFVKNKRQGLHGAVLTGFEESKAPIVMMMPADDSWNARIIDQMVDYQKSGFDIVCPSRFMKGGSVEGYPKLKYLIVRIAAFLLYKLAFIPTQDPTNGFRCFSRRVIDQIPIESEVGGTYSLELLVKAHRLRWKIIEVPSTWIERKAGKSKFKVWKWIPHYLEWFLYGFATAYLRKKYVKLKRI